MMDHPRIHAMGRFAAVVASGLVLACLGAPALAQRAEPMLRQEISVPNHPKALCNDGSTPIMYTQPGSGEDRNRWVIYFQGGGGCTTDEECLSRAMLNHSLTSSVDANLPASIIPEGILSTVPAVNPDFARYNHVFLHYCSSDAYAGDGERRIGPATWQFRGTEIVTAMLDQLSAPQDPSKPSLKDATDVLVAGGSAGAMGVGHNLDRIADRLAPARVVGVLDSAWVPYGIAPFATGSFDVRPDTAAAFAYHNAAPDASCLAANPGQPGACMNLHFALPHIKAPTFVFADHYDPALLAVLGISNAPRMPAERAYADDYARKVHETLAAASPAHFIADNGRHTVLLLRQFNTVTAGRGGPTLGSVLHNWYFGGGPTTAAAPSPLPKETP